MKIITYLVFTLLSIFIQFCVMDFIQGISKKGNNLNATEKKQLKDVLKDFQDRPALYYKVKRVQYSNSSLTDTLSDQTTTDMTTTILDILYEDNSTSTEETYTTEMFTTTEFDNVTEITFFGKNNQSIIKPDKKPKKSNVECSCNIMYRVCDVNCCCDPDCAVEEIKLFPLCKETPSIQKEDVCYNNYLTYFGDSGPTNMFDNLFCVANINIPSKNNNNEEETDYSVKIFYSWKANSHRKVEWEFRNRNYEYGDPIWLIRNGTIYFMDSPSQTVTSYCSGRKPIMFLKNEKHQCKVKFRDLEMIQLLRNLNETYVLTATPLSVNTSVLNCSNLHCVNWTILICTNYECTHFDKSKHDPFCTETICTNIALDLEYTFYYQESKIVNATVKFHVQNVSVEQYMSQSTLVRFVMANESIDTILKLSGNPGYLEGLPVIVSYSKSNFTDTFFNKTDPRHLLLPRNEKGKCIFSNVTNNFVSYGMNKRYVCKYYQSYKSLKNRTKECRTIQENIMKFLRFDKNSSISPLGNPQDLKDEDWLPIRCFHSNSSYIYGYFNGKKSVLECYNIAPRFSIVFHVANRNGHNKIIAVSCDYTMRNVSISVDDELVGINLIMDIRFVDIAQPSVLDEDSPSLNLQIPQDFFYPFPSSESHRSHQSKLIVLLNLIAIVSCK